MAKGKLIAADEAKISTRQHVKPCSDCPFLRDSLPGWLGGGTAEDFHARAHGEDRMECHTLKNKSGQHWECAGAAIYRANICKRTRDRSLLELPRDAKRVFSFGEFIPHHAKVK